MLGASNLARSFPTVVDTVRRTWGEPVEIMAAMGLGRSYGQDSAVLGRKISGIFPCALWQELLARPPLPTAALLTDIGNDILYGVPPDRLLEWVAACLDRLEEAGAKIIVTELPIASLARLGEARFRFFRGLFFPRSQLTLADARALAAAVNEGLAAAGKSRKISVISMSESWYGFDPIHIRRRVWWQAWPSLLAPWRAAGAPIEPARSSFWTSVYLHTLAPHERSLLGVRRRAAQPSGRLSDGTTISLY